MPIMIIKKYNKISKANLVGTYKLKLVSIEVTLWLTLVNKKNKNFIE